MRKVTKTSDPRSVLSRHEAPPDSIVFDEQCGTDGCACRTRGEEGRQAGSLHEASRRYNDIVNPKEQGPNRKGLGPDASNAPLGQLSLPRSAFCLESAASVIGSFRQTHEHRHDPGVAFIGLGINEKPVRQK